MAIARAFLVSALCAAVALAAPTTAPAADSWSGNPLQGVQMWPNRFYADQVRSLALPRMAGDLARKAEAVAKVPSFQWLDTKAKIPIFRAALQEIRDANRAGASPPYAGIFVVYNFPDRDCSAKASDGELHLADDGLGRYKREYIDKIREAVVEFSDVRAVFVYEPDSFPNLVTSMGIPKCAGAADAYKEGAAYAISALNLPNVALYLDAGHAGWLGSRGNLAPTARLFGEIFEAAGRPRAVRGLVTNVSNFNAWNLTSAPLYAGRNANWDESRYVSSLAPYLADAGFPPHFLVDTGRSGQQPAGRSTWSQWCNVVGAGFGPRPTTDTRSSPPDLVDAFVWVKPGGEADGTSDRAAARYDENCGTPEAMQPAPEAGEWFQAYFEKLVELANPPL